MMQLGKIAKSSLLRTSGVYTVSSLLNASIPFLLLPILTKYLSNSEYGILTMFSAVSIFLAPFVGINMEGAIARQFYNDRNNISTYIGTCVIVSTVSALICSLLCILLRDLIFKYTSIDTSWMLLCVFYCFTQFIILIFLTINQVKVKPLNYGLTQISQSVFNFVISFLLIVFLHYKWEGRLIAQITSSLSIAFVAIIILFVKREIIFSFNYKFFKHAIKFGSGLIPHALGFAMIILTNRVFLLQLENIKAVGLYAVAVQVGSIISFFTVSFNSAYIPWLYNNLKKDCLDVKSRIVRLTYLYFLVLTISGIIFYLLLPYIFNLFINHNFYSGLKLCVYIIPGFVFQGMYFMVTNYITYAEKTYYQAFVTLFVGVITIPANYFLILKFGSVGASLAYSLSFFLLFVFSWFVSSKIYRMPW